MIVKFLILLIIIQGLLVILSKNSVTSVLYLIGIYICTSICFLILGAEFLAILLVIVYVGAVSILFIFVVMMLNLRILEVYQTTVTYLPIGLFFGFFFMFEIIYMIQVDIGFVNCYSGLVWINYKKLLLSSNSNLYVIGVILYNNYYFLIWFAGLVLLLAMIGAIALTIDTYDTAQLFKNKEKLLIFRKHKNNVKFWSLGSNYYKKKKTL